MPPEAETDRKTSKRWGTHVETAQGQHGGQKDPCDLVARGNHTSLPVQKLTHPIVKMRGMPFQMKTSGVKKSRDLKGGHLAKGGILSRKKN